MKKKDESRPRIRSTAELAKHLGLSRWTVSRALNGHPGIKSATLQRVKEAVTRFQFAPSPMARALRGGRTGTVGICLQELELFNLTSKISSLHGRLRQNGFHVLLEFSDGREESESEILHHFIAMQVEGVAILSGLLSHDSPAFRALRQAGIPIVMIDPHFPSAGGTVWIDRAGALQRGARHLLKLGHRRFASLGIDPHSYYGTVRSRALEEYLSPPHAPSNTRLIHLFEPEARQMDFGYGMRLAERVLAESKRPTALIALNDRIAWGAMEFLKRRGFQVPRDFSVLGYDNSDISSFAVPALTTFAPQIDLLIEDGCKLLLHDIAHKNHRPSPSRRIVPKLILRDSTAPPQR